jgi:hypothetical protein
VILGAAFWARNDVVLFCVALGVTHLMGVFPGGARELKQRFLEMSCTGAVVALLATPWLMFNHSRFGSIVPISGQAESLHAKFAENLGAVPVNAFEYMSFVVPVPRSFDERPWVIAGASIVVIGLLVLLWRHARRWEDARKGVVIFGTIAMLIFGAFYGLYFGAGHFMSRYLLALSPLSALLWARLAVCAEVTFGERKLGLVATLLLPLACVLVLYLNVRGFRLGSKHQHFQVVEWIEANVPDSVWIGAVQSGTVGYFHDRTLNLDGKVNPEALAAQKADRVLEYTVASKAEYLADWIGMKTWMRPPLSDAFEVIVSDPERNLAVLRRKPASGVENR